MCFQDETTKALQQKTAASTALCLMRKRKKLQNIPFLQLWSSLHRVQARKPMMVFRGLEEQFWAFRKNVSLKNRGSHLQCSLFVKQTHRVGEIPAQRHLGLLTVPKLDRHLIWAYVLHAQRLMWVPMHSVLHCSCWKIETKLIKNWPNFFLDHLYVFQGYKALYSRLHSKGQAHKKTAAILHIFILFV